MLLLCHSDDCGCFYASNNISSPLTVYAVSTRFQQRQGAHAFPFSGSIKRKKYQHEPAHWGIVFVSRRAGEPVRGSVVCSHSVAFTRGLSVLPEGLNSSISGNSTGKSASGTAAHAHCVSC